MLKTYLIGLAQGFTTPCDNSTSCIHLFRASFGSSKFCYQEVTPEPLSYLIRTMKFNLFSALSIFLFSISTWSIECLGPKEAKNSVVYLHGMDTQAPGQQEVLIREKLSALATKLNLRIALPRASDKCPPDAKLICWGWNFNDAKVIDASLAASALSAKECFPEAKTMGLIGFSNGGFVANQIIKDCRRTPFSWFFSIGAAGSWKKDDSKDLSKCGRLYLFAGKQDKSNYSNIKNFSVWLKEQKATIELIEYEEGHTVPSKELEQSLKKLLL